MNSNKAPKGEVLKTAQNDALFGDDARDGDSGLTALPRVLHALPYSLALQAPPPELKLKVLSAIREHEKTVEPIPSDTNTEPGRQAAASPVQLWKNWTTITAASDLTIQRKDAGAWEKTGVEGVEVKRLFVDQARDYVTMLVRMAPGSSYPSHRHGGFEECYVLEGDLSVGDTVLDAGDYQRAEGGSIHGIQSTRDGCLLFIVSSQYDELLA